MKTKFEATLSQNSEITHQFFEQKSENTGESGPGDGGRGGPESKSQGVGRPPQRHVHDPMWLSLGLKIRAFF